MSENVQTKPAPTRCPCGVTVEPDFFEAPTVQGRIFWPARWMPREECAGCAEAREARRQADERAEQLRELRRLSAVPPVFASAKIEELPAPLRSAVECWLRGEYGLLIHGGVGVGKSFAAAAAVNSRIERALRPCPWKSAPALFRELRRATLDGRDGEMIEALVRAEAVVLDDLGVGGATEFAGTSLFEVADKLFAHQRRGLIVTSNWGPDELAQRIDDRTVSRLRSLCRVIKLSGPDRRSRPGGTHAAHD